jgi:predicted exporter
MAAVAAVGVWTFANLSVTTEITHFLPASEDRELARIAREMTESELNRSITLVLAGPDEETTVAAAKDLAERLEGLEEVAWVRSGPGDDLNEAFYALYFERRLGFFTDRPEEAAEGPLSDEALAEAARELKRRLVGPTGAFVRRIAPRDPLLAFPRHLERLRDAQQGSLRIVDGQLVTEDGRAVVFLASAGSPFDGERAAALQRGLDAALAAVREAHGPIEVEQSGVHRFALASEEAIRADVTRISVVSGVGVVLLFLLLFRSPRHLLLGAVPLGAGFVAGLAATQLLFGRIHGLSLAFGATLIGVGIDYVAHAVNHHTLAPAKGGPAESLRRIGPGLALGAATTIAGLAGLAWTSFPGIRELAVFTSVGVLVALLTTRFALPPWMPAEPRPTRLHAALAAALGRALERLRRSRAALAVLPALALVTCAAGLARLEWVDDVRALNTLDPALVAEDERVRAAVSRMDGGRFVIAWGPDEATALRRNDAVHRRLTEAREAGELERFRSLHSLLWSPSLQRESHAALRDAPRLWPRLREALEAEGFVPSLFEPFRDELAASPEPLTWDELAASPLGSLVSSFRVDLDGGRVAFVTLTRGADPDAVEARLAGLEGVRLFDQARFLQDAYGGFRTRTLEMIGVGLVAVFLIVLARYRRLGPALAAFVPAVLAAATALATLVLLGYEANLMHLVALLLVLSMGVDYGVFMVESRHHEEGPAPTVVSLLVACVSTVLSFGLLAMSANPALRALGLVTGLGVLLSLLLAPTAWLLLARPEAPR